MRTAIGQEGADRPDNLEPRVRERSLGGGAEQPGKNGLARSRLENPTQLTAQAADCDGHGDKIGRPSCLDHVRLQVGARTGHALLDRNGVLIARLQKR
jgi:hypothetical protein